MALLLNGTAALHQFPSLAQFRCLQGLQSHFKADPGGPSVVGETYQPSSKGRETPLFGQHLPFMGVCLPFSLVRVAERKQGWWQMLYGETLTLFNFVPGGVYSLFIQLIRGDFLEEVTGRAAQKKALKNFGSENMASDASFPFQAGGGGAFFSEPCKPSPPIGTGEVPG